MFKVLKIVDGLKVSKLEENLRLSREEKFIFDYHKLEMLLIRNIIVMSVNKDAK